MRKSFVGQARVELGDINMHFEVNGSGSPLLPLHGGFGSANDWSNQIPSGRGKVSTRGHSFKLFAGSPSDWEGRLSLRFHRGNPSEHDT